MGARGEGEGAGGGGEEAVGGEGGVLGGGGHYWRNDGRNGCARGTEGRKAVARGCGFLAQGWHKSDPQRSQECNSWTQEYNSASQECNSATQTCNSATQECNSATREIKNVILRLKNVILQLKNVILRIKGGEIGASRGIPGGVMRKSVVARGCGFLTE